MVIGLLPGFLTNQSKIIFGPLKTKKNFKPQFLRLKNFGRSSPHFRTLELKNFKPQFLRFTTASKKKQNHITISLSFSTTVCLPN